MARPAIRPARLDDLPALTEIYNHYVVHTAITFDLHPFAPDERRAWFEEHATNGRHRLLVAADGDGAIAGYATTSLAREGGVRHNGRGNRLLPRERRGKRIRDRVVRRAVRCAGRRGCPLIVAGVTLPNPASLRLHERFGFVSVGVFRQVGRKFDTFWDVAWFERPLRLAGTRE